MTPFGFVFLTLMLGVIVPTHGKIKLTFWEAMNMSSSDLEKRLVQGGNEFDALRRFMSCLGSTFLGIGDACDDAFRTARMEDAARKYGVIEDIPLEVWVRIARLKCGPSLVCSVHCECPSPGIPCGRQDRMTKGNVINCSGEYEEWRKYSRRVASGVSGSKSGWCTTVFVATAISRRLIFSP